MDDEIGWPSTAVSEVRYVLAGFDRTTERHVADVPISPDLARSLCGAEWPLVGCLPVNLDWFVEAGAVKREPFPFHNHRTLAEVWGLTKEQAG